MKKGSNTILGRWKQSEAARKAHTTHGMKGTREYHSWRSMKQRCLCKNDPFYETYGGKGVKICKRWLNSFENFYEDMGPRPEGKSLDRFPDNDGDYTPNNCRWATQKEQQRNRTNTRLVLINGETRSFTEWCEIYGINRRTADSRIHKGWTIKRAITAKLQRSGNIGNTGKKWE